MDKSIKIVTLLQLMGIKRTHSEEKKTKRYKEKYIKTIKERYGEDVTNPSQLEHVQKRKKILFLKNMVRMIIICKYNEII